jgi:predicted SAM-dependent methyltransferase
MKYLNLGCGARFHPDWENVDMYPYGPGVRVHDLTKKIPYDNGTFDVVYHSHVLEHFPKKQAVAFLEECHRLLKLGGLIRVAVPDLECIARVYIEALGKASSGVPGWADNYDWIVMEMLDQAIREESCGALIEYFNRNPIPNRDFVVKRWGTYVEPLIEKLRGHAGPGEQSLPQSRTAWRYILRHPREVLRNKLVRKLLAPADLEALRVGRFRRGGEVHMWMYDHYSLGKLLEGVGFVHPRQLGPAESGIPGWAGFHLDAEPDGQIFKADSLYMEALKP